MNKIHFSRKELIKIVEKSSTITERLGNEFICDIDNNNDNIVTSRIDQWCQIASQGNWKKFENRLAWDGLDIATIHRVLSPVRMANEQKLPAWTETLNECMKATTSSVLESLEQALGNNCSALFQEPLPFQEFLLPFLDVARKKLLIHTGLSYDLLSKQAHDSLEHNLLRWLSFLCSPSLEFEFSVFYTSRQSTVAQLLGKLTRDYYREKYRDFIKSLFAGGVLEFFLEYPVLARLVATTIDFWVNAFGELISRLASDHSAIKKTFKPEIDLGKVIHIEPFLSDRHNHGRSITALTFSSGLKLIYKPKNVDVEQAYFNLLAWFNKHDIPLKFKLLKILNCDKYGWVEFADTLPCKDEQESLKYYQRAGMLVCLLYVLEATDIHIENIIACGEHPVLIDLETLMHPHVKETEALGVFKSSQHLAHEQLGNSVLRTGLLPRWSFIEDDSYDFSGLGGIAHEKSSQMLKWYNIHRDTMSLLGYEYEKSQLPIDNNLVDTKYNLFTNSYQQEVINGFKKMYVFLLKNIKKILQKDGPLKEFSHQEIRFIFRATKIYTFILRNSLKPKFLRDGSDRSIQLDILSRVICKKNDKPIFFDVIRLEQQALEEIDIPLLTARSDSDALTIAPNQTIEKYFTEPSFNRVIARLNKLDDQDLEQQIFFIKGSLYSRTAEQVHGLSTSENGGLNLDTVLPLTQEKILQQARMIAAYFQKQAIRSSDGSATWFTSQYILKAQRFQLQPMEHGLFDGCDGIALFLAGIETVTKDSKYKDISLGSLQSFRQAFQNATSDSIRKMVPLGGAVGYGSNIYTRVRISRFLKNPSLLQAAKQIATSITPDLLAADQHFDIISGTAGAILGLLALHNISHDSEIIEKAILCGNHLLNNRVASDSGYRAWATSDGKLLTGFSHGAAGIAYALLRLYQASGETTFLEAAQEAIAYERSVFIPEEGNWPDFRQSAPKERPTCMCSWCHGAPGIGLARVATLDILDTPEIRQDIEAAINTTKQHGLSEIDHLCCGNMGRIEFLFTAGRKLSRPDLVEEAMKQAAQVVARAQQRGHFGYGSILDFHPGFFQGASGIGYELLRLAYPDQLPSVLLWE